MLNTTDDILYKAGSDTRELIIKDDHTLRAGAIKAIADKLGACPQLERFGLINCDLTADMMGPLVAALVAHPAVGHVDLSQNNFTSLDFAVQLGGVDPFSWAGNRRITGLRLTGNKQPIDPRSYANFLKAVWQADHLAELSIEGDPWSQSSLRHPSRLIGDTRNLIQLTIGTLSEAYRDSLFDREMPTNQDKAALIAPAIAANRQQAEALARRVESAHIITRDDIDSINERLPAVFTLLQTKHQRDRAVELLQNFDRRVRAELKQELDLGCYLPKATRVKPQIAPAPGLNADTADIATILAGLSPADPNRLRQQIRATRNLPRAIDALGQEFEQAATGMAVAAITVMTSLPLCRSAAAVMNDFVSGFDTARGEIETLLGRSIRSQMTEAGQTMTQPKAKPGFWASLLAMPVTLADAGRTVVNAAGKLRNVQTELHNIDTVYADQLAATREVIGGFDQLKQRFDQIVTIGGEVLQEWHSEETARQTLAAATAPNAANPQSIPYDIHMLAERVAYLRESANSLQTQCGKYIVHADKLMANNIAYGKLITQSLPILQATVDGFSRDLNNSGIDNKSRLEGAPARVQSIDSQTTLILKGFREHEQAATKLRQQIGNLYPDQFAALPEPVPVHPDGGQSAARHMPSAAI